MRSEDIQEIAAAMATAGLARLELTGPDFRLMLGWGTNAEPRTVEPEAGIQGETVTPDAEAVAVTSPGVGTFLRAHPLHDRPLAVAGDHVAAGQTIAVLRLGTLLLPVVAPVAAVVIDATLPEGTLVGYGDRLFDLLPQD